MPLACQPHANLALQSVMLDMLFSYELPWLRIGLETIFGETINVSTKKGDAFLSCVSECPKWKLVLKGFIIENLFSSADICSKFDQEKLLYVHNENKMKLQLRQHLAINFLALVAFLDSARIHAVLPKSTLFQRKSTYKSSEAIIVNFCREFLKCEGDVLKHLTSIG